MRLNRILRSAWAHMSFCRICCTLSLINLYKTYEPPHDKTNKMILRPAKTQISLCICPVWSESSLCAQWVAKDPSFLHADSEDSVHTGRMPRLIWVFAWRTCHFVGFFMRRLNIRYRSIRMQVRRTDHNLNGSWMVICLKSKALISWR